MLTKRINRCHNRFVFQQDEFGSVRLLMAPWPYIHLSILKAHFILFRFTFTTKFELHAHKITMQDWINPSSRDRIPVCSTHHSITGKESFCCFLACLRKIMLLPRLFCASCLLLGFLPLLQFAAAQSVSSMGKALKKAKNVQFPSGVPHDDTCYPQPNRNRYEE